MKSRKYFPSEVVLICRKFRNTLLHKATFWFIRSRVRTFVPLIEEASLWQEDFVNADYQGNQAKIQERCYKLFHEVQKFKSTGSSPFGHYADNVEKLFGEESLEIKEKNSYSREDVQAVLEAVLEALVKLEEQYLEILKFSSSTVKNVLEK